MKREEMLQLIETVIKGQGNQVDCGGALGQLLKTAIARSVAAEVDDIEKMHEIPGLLDSLEVGDKVVKKTGNDRHLYLVTYKATTGGGMCLTYADASNVETVAYDRTESGWDFNSTDQTHIGA